MAVARPRPGALGAAAGHWPLGRVERVSLLLKLRVRCHRGERQPDAGQQVARADVIARRRLAAQLDVNVVDVNVVCEERKNPASDSLKRAEAVV